MKLYSTNDKSNVVSLKEAIFKSLPKDRGLYMPMHIPTLSESFFDQLKNLSFQDIGFEVTRALFDGYIPENDLKELINNSLTFPAPVVKLNEQLFILELFHGPSLAFKDFGARFMAQVMSYLNKDEDRELTILVATSGDTGGAVAAGFYEVEGIEVIILYPSGGVSTLQEKQLTTLGKNITAIEIEGTFDDCQALVKSAFLDDDLNQKYRLSSANSINIARLIPQSFYYYEAYKQLPDDGMPTVFCIPSGNFGNLTAGLMAKKMGLPIDGFIAATNINDTVPSYLSSGIFNPKPSQKTISNAMDVGNPSNFSRMLDLYSSTWNILKNDIVGYVIDDKTTRRVIKDVESKHNYIIDPHGAVGIEAANLHLKENNEDSRVVVLETAHPAKFLEVMERTLEHDIEIPEALSKLYSKKKEAEFLQKEYKDFKEWLLVR